jgi:predicted porin
MGKITVGASVGRLDDNRASYDSNFFSVSGKYDLSKRTFAYGYYAGMNNGLLATRNTNGGPTAKGTGSAVAGVDNKNASSVGLGLVHLF